MKFDITNIEDLNIPINLILNKNYDQMVFLLKGNMGMGKTTFVNKFLEKLKVKDIVTSPTFSLVNEYRLQNETIYHFDLYRINDINELFLIGIEDYFIDYKYIFVEWPEILKNLLNTNYTEIEINIENDKRYLEIKEINNKILN